MVLRHDPLIGQRYVPNQRARVPFDDGGYLVETNSLGFRSDREFVSARGDRPRILFLGDSYTAGYGVDNGERFPELAGEMLGAEIYNAGLTGSGTDQQVLAYEAYLSDIECDLIVLAVWVENIERNKAEVHVSLDPHTERHVATHKPFFRLDAQDGLELHGVPVPIEREPADGIDIYGRPMASEASGGLAGRIGRIVGRERLERLRGGVGQDAYRWLQRTTGFQRYPDYADESSEGWRLMAAIVDRLAAAAAGTPLLIVPVPTSEYFRRHAPLKPVYQERFAALRSSERGIHVADITAPLRNSSPDDLAGLTFATDAHFSRHGHRVVAGYVADAIAETGALPTATQRKRQEPPSTPDPHFVLGISCFYHNSAAALLRDGELVAAVEEERFTRKKADRSFPLNAANFCLEEAGISPRELSSVVYYDNAYLTFERLMHSQLAVGEEGVETWERVVPSWVQQKLRIPELIRGALGYDGDVYQASHHRSHAASAFYMSPFDSAAVLTIDGVGEWSTATIGVGKGGDLQLLHEMQFPHSVGLLYSAFTQFVGFKVNNGEYKMMGLAPYGEPIYADAIYENVVDVKTDGSIELNMEFFRFLEGRTMTSHRFDELFGGPPRGWDDPITQREMDISASIQEVTAEIVMRMARHAHQLTGERRLCLAGGVALNCVANGKLLRDGPFDEVWIQPAAGDSGGALGAALDLWHTHHERPRTLRPDGRSPQHGSYWGPAYSDSEIQAFLDSSGFPYEVVEPGERAKRVAAFIDDGLVVGHFSGRTEFGPRALGARSILGDARQQETQTKLNLQIKYRESFRPFAPSVLIEEADQYFDLSAESPYMLVVAPVRENRRLPFRREPDMDAYEIVRQPRSDIPAVTHIDYSARVQTVDRPDHPDYYDVIAAFRDDTSTGLVVNTSFNVRGEPIVSSPYDAYSCFMRTEMDVLILGNQVLLKSEQPDWHEEKGHLEEGEVHESKPPDTPLAAAVREVFVNELVPVLRQLSDAGLATKRILTEPAETTWTGAGLQDHRFEIPAPLSRPGGTPAARASEVCSFWRPDAVTEALQPVVERLLSVGDDHDVSNTLVDATVSEHIYVLY